MTLEEEIALVNSVVLTAEQEADIDEAIRNAQEPEDESVALRAFYEPAMHMLMMELKSGQRLAIPVEDLQGMSSASPDNLAAVEIVSSGTALHWEALDEGFLVGPLRQGIYGNKRWMDGLAQRRRERLEKAS